MDKHNCHSYELYPDKEIPGNYVLDLMEMTVKGSQPVFRLSLSRERICDLLEGFSHALRK